jgi:hypothetical protein
VWVLQAALLAVVAVLVARALARHWREFRLLDVALELDLGWVVFAGSVVLATYGLLIAAWRMLVLGWGERLGFATAARIWAVSNLGRYLPGRIWGLAGLAALAQRAGVAAWAAVGSAVAMQAVALGSGAAVIVGTTPGAATPAALAAAGAIALVTVAALAVPRSVGLVSRLTRQPDLRPLPIRAVATAGLITALGWFSYGVAFWALARGLIGPNELPVATASGVFAAGYLAGLLALVVPSGLGVREAVFIALLTPSLGAGGAVTLSVASRLLLTATEAAAALLAAAFGHRTPSVPPAQ